MAFVRISRSSRLQSRKRLQTPVQSDIHFDDVQARLDAHLLKKNWISHTPGVLLVRICLRHKK